MEKEKNETRDRSLCEKNYFFLGIMCTLGGTHFWHRLRGGKATKILQRLREGGRYAFFTGYFPEKYHPRTRNFEQPLRGGMGQMLMWDPLIKKMIKINRFLVSYQWKKNFPGAGSPWTTMKTLHINRAHEVAPPELHFAPLILQPLRRPCIQIQTCMMQRMCG